MTVGGIQHQVVDPCVYQHFDMSAHHPGVIGTVKPEERLSPPVIFGVEQLFSAVKAVLEYIRTAFAVVPEQVEDRGLTTVVPGAVSGQFPAQCVGGNYGVDVEGICTYPYVIRVVGR